jgi:hypothetical protein
MPTLSSYTNVHDTAIQLLRDEGFQVWRDKSAGLYFAERDGWDFAADDPVALLGVVAIFKHRRPVGYVEYWWRNESAKGASSSLPDAPERAYASVATRHTGAPQ